MDRNGFVPVSDSSKHSLKQPSTEEFRSIYLSSDKPRLLVIEKEDSLRLTTVAILENEGYIVDTATNAEEAIELLQEVEYDLVMTDLDMEKVEDLSVLNQIRTRTPLTVVVVLTDVASVDSAVSAFLEGAYDYLVRPCDIDSLRRTVRRGIERRRLNLIDHQARIDLENLNRDLEQQLDDRTAEVIKLNDELNEAHRAKDVFLATLSHELRTPLTPIVGWLRLLRGGSLDDQGVSDALEAIERNAWLQSRLIDDLLDTSRIATGKLKFEPQPADLNKAVTAAIDTVRTSAVNRNIQMVVRIHTEPLVVQGEPVRLQQIAWNLISNAIKFTEPGGSVSVTTVPTPPDSAVLVVEDTGVGIAPDFLPHVFDRFRQADGSRSRLHGGLGLGLAIAQALTRMHGGTLEAHSEGAGLGSRFTLTIKLAEKSATIPVVENKKGPSLTGLKVLLVEDSDDTLVLLRALFARQGARVTSATSAEEALSLVRSSRPHLIVSDIGMPHTDGYAFLERLRVLPGLDSVPAIAISGYASDEDRTRALAVGYAAFVAKPLDSDELFGIVRNLVRQGATVGKD